MTNQLLVHKHLIVRAESLAPLVDEQISINWMYDFIKFVNMKPMIGPFAKYSQMPGNKGLTIAAIIETSHIVMHMWDEPNPSLIQFDLYSCGEFNPEEICKKIKNDFECSKIEYKFIDREKELKDVSGGSQRFSHLYKTNYKERMIKEKNTLMLKNRKEVNINFNGPGYTIKHGPNKGKVLRHISVKNKDL